MFLNTSEAAPQTLEAPPARSMFVPVRQPPARMILPVQRIVRTRIAEAVAALYGIAPDDPALAAIVVDVPPRRALGDLAVPLAFELARRLRKAPKIIAQEIVGQLGQRRRVRADRSGERLHQFLPRSGAPSRRLAERRRGGAARRIPKKPSSSTPPSTRTRRRTSATCATPRSATPSAGCSATWAALSRSRTTSTTPASRSPTSPSASASSKERTSPAFARIADTHALRLLLLGPLRPGDRVVRSRQGPSAHPLGGAARHRARRQRDGGHRAADRRPHRPAPSRDDGAAEHRLRPAHLGRRHPSPALLDPRLRVPEAHRRSLPADRGQAEGLLGDAHRGRDGRRRRTREPEGEGEEEQREKVIVRSDGTVTYVGKDMAYQLWKFGLLGRDFFYRKFTSQNGRVLWSTTSDESAAEARPGIRPCLVGVQRHRHAAVLPAEAGEAGARGARLPRAGGTLGSLLVRDGCPVALDGAGAWLRHEHRRRPAVRRGVGPQGTGREGRRSHRPANRQGQPGSRQAQHRLACRRGSPHRGGDRHRRGPLLHGEVLARQGHRLRHRRGPQLRGRERSIPAIRGRACQQHLQQAEGAREPRRGGRGRRAGARLRPSR